MRRQKNQRQVELKHEFDRLAAQKMEQVYDILFLKTLDQFKEDKKRQLTHAGKKA